MIKSFWNYIVMVCAIMMLIMVPLDWYTGASAGFYVWMSSILFTLEMGLEALQRIFEPDQG